MTKYQPQDTAKNISADVFVYGVLASFFVFAVVTLASVAVSSWAVREARDSERSLTDVRRRADECRDTLNEARGELRFVKEWLKEARQVNGAVGGP